MSIPLMILESTTYNTEAKYGVILTSYGRDTLLRKAISSILSQTFKDFLLFIIDDNSPQINHKTQPIIREFLADPRVIFFRTLTTPRERLEKSTFCQNINHILDLLLHESMFRAQYVCYLPCDDTFKQNKLREVDIYLKNQPSTPYCYHGINLYNERGTVLHTVPSGGYDIPVAYPYQYLDHGCVVHRLDVLKYLPKPWWPTDKGTEHISPDGDFYSKLVELAGPIPPIGKILGSKLRHEDSIQGRKLGC